MTRSQADLMDRNRWSTTVRWTLPRELTCAVHQNAAIVTVCCMMMTSWPDGHSTTPTIIPGELLLSSVVLFFPGQLSLAFLWGRVPASCTVLFFPGQLSLASLWGRVPASCIVLIFPSQLSLAFLWGRVPASCIVSFSQINSALHFCGVEYQLHV